MEQETEKKEYPPKNRCFDWSSGSIAHHSCSYFFDRFSTTKHNLFYIYFVQYAYNILDSMNHFTWTSCDGTFYNSNIQLFCSIRIATIGIIVDGLIRIILGLMTNDMWIVCSVCLMIGILQEESHLVSFRNKIRINRCTQRETRFYRSIE